MLLLRAALLLASTLVTTARHSPPRLLLYTPLHVSEPTRAVHAFASCLFGRQPSLRGLKFDVLISVSGAKSDGRNVDLERIIADASGSANVSVTFTTLHDDTYALSLSNDHRRGEAWVSGPNDAFYGALLSGPVYESYIRQYDLVQQLETDVCAMADGWLDVLLEPMLHNPRLLISGARTACDCVYDAIHDVCEPMSKHGDHMTAHVNGNAAYRIGPELRRVLTRAQATYNNTEPFDLAVYWTMKEAGMLSRLHINPRYLNTPCLVDRTRFTLPAYHATPDAVAIHAPRRLRTTSLQAVASRGLNRAKQAKRTLHTLTVVAVTHVDEDVLNVQQSAFDNSFVEGVVYVADDQATYDAVSHIAPLRVMAAFGDAGDEHARATSHHDPVPALESWPASTTLAGSLMTAVARIVALGHDVFLVGLDAVPLANYGGKLAGLDRKAVHVACVDEASALPAMAYLPSSDGVAAGVYAWALALRQGQAMTYQTLTSIAHQHAISLTHLPWSDFVVRGPLLASGWPGGTLKRRAVVAVGNEDVAFHARAARAWPRDARVACANYSIVSRRPVNLTSGTATRIITRHAEFAAFVAAQRIQCVVVPGFALPVTRSRVHVGALLHLSTFSQACGNATLLPSRAWIEPDARRIKFTRKHTRSVAALPLARPLEAALGVARARLGPKFTCVRDPHRSLDEIAVLAVTNASIDGWIDDLRQQHGIAPHRTLLLTGAWKGVRGKTVASRSTALRTLADVVGDDALRLLTPTLAPTDTNRLLDPAWADVVEGLICSRQATSIVDADSTFPPPLSIDAITTALLPHIPEAVLRRDLAALRHWRQRSDRVKPLRPPIAVLGPPSPATLTMLHALADVQPSRAIVPPIRVQGWPNTAYTPPNVLPPSALALALPRLAPVLAGHGVLLAAPDPQSRSLAAQYFAELATVKHFARRWEAAVVWIASGHLTLTDAMSVVRVVPPRDAGLLSV